MQLFVRDKQFYKTTVKIAVPIVLQSMITIGVNMMDTFMVGKLGEVQLSATSLANEFINIFHIMCMGMGYGAAVLTAQYWGAKDIPSLKKITAIMLRICLVLATLFMVLTLAAPEWIMKLYTKDTAIIAEGEKYFTISAFTYLLLGLSLTLTAIMRSVREVKLPLITSIIAFFVNIFFNWVFIFGNLGAPAMGVEGAALGTLIARVVETGIIAGYFLFLDKKVEFRIPDIFVNCREYIPRYLKYCIPVLISDTLLAFGNNMVAVIMGHIGAAFVAANAIVAQVQRMSTVFTQGVSNASSVITGNTLGTGDKKKTYEQGVTFLSLSVLIGLVAGGIILAICPLIVGGFDLADDTRQIADQLMYAVAIMIIFQSVNSVLTKGVLRGGGDTRFLMVADILFLWLASIPLGYLAGLVLHLPAFWIYAALKADWVIKSVWCTFRLLKGNWMKRTV
jgi:putative MATE family efflux protein